MKILSLLLACFYTLSSLCQSFSESDIKGLAERINQELSGIDIGNGVLAKGCLSIGRTLIYQYEVPDYWESPENIKDEIISNLKTAGAAKNYFLYDINVDFHYYRGNSLIKKVSVKSNEFSTYNYKLGDYISIKDHPKSKGVNLKLKVPEGWEVKEGNRPNVVKNITKNGNSYIVLTKDNATFFSRKEMKEILEEENVLNELVHEANSFLKNPEVIEQSVLTIDSYPTVYFKAKGKMEGSGVTFSAIIKCWIVYYEDKIIFLQSMGYDNAEYRALEHVFFSITNSVIFPDQYE